MLPLRLPRKAALLLAVPALTLLSDGVVAARNAAGELFGFERARAISSEPADAIAQAAQAFGQEDDITILTLTRLEPSQLPFSRLAASDLAPA